MLSVVEVHNMKMLRHYFVSTNLDDLELFEEQLESAGVASPQIHVLSKDVAAVEHHIHLHEISSFMEKDVLHSGEIGVIVGAIGAALVILVAYYTGWAESLGSWVPFVFLAIIIFGFCIWEGGLVGIQSPNNHFKRFQKVLTDGKHIFFVDLEPNQETILTELIDKHPQVELTGTGTAVPHWLLILRLKFFKFTDRSLLSDEGIHHH